MSLLLVFKVGPFVFSSLLQHGVLCYPKVSLLLFELLSMMRIKDFDTLIHQLRCFSFSAGPRSCTLWASFEISMNRSLGYSSGTRRSLHNICGRQVRYTTIEI